MVGPRTLVAIQNGVMPNRVLELTVDHNAGAITDYTERWHHGEIISTAFVESTVNVVVAKRLAKK